MNNGEYYSSREYNDIKEYKPFPAEIYSKTLEVNPSGKEEADLGKEITTMQGACDKRNKKDGSLIDKVLNSLKTVATTATVAVASIVVTTTFVINNPKVSDVNIETGSDYVEYEMTIDNMNSDVDYSIVITTSNEEERKIPATKNGSCKNRVEGLKPSWEYTLALVGENTELGRITYYETRFQTKELKSPVNNNSPPKSEDKAGFELVPPSPDEIDITWESDDCVIKLPVSFTPIGEECHLYLIAYKNGNEIGRAEHKNGEIELKLPQNVGICELELSVYEKGESKEKITLGEIDTSFTGVTLLDAKLIGIDLLEISFELFGQRQDYIYTNLILDFTYPDGTVSSIEIGEEEIKTGALSAAISHFEGEMTIGYRLLAQDSSGENQIAITNESAMVVSSAEIQSIKVMVNKKYGMIEFHTSIFSKGAGYILIEVNGGEALTNGDIYNVMTYYNSEMTGVEEYSLYYSNEAGEKLELIGTYVIDFTYADKVERTFNYKNPSDVGITYNDDGGMNVYISTDFACEDPDVFYMIALGDSRLYRFTDSVARIYNLPKDYYGITYYICKEVDGIIYISEVISPSGAVGESYGENMVSGSITGRTASVVLYEINGAEIDFSSVKIIGSNGEEISLMQEDFTQNENMYSASVEFASDITEAYVSVRINEFAEDLEGIEDIIGDAYRTITITIYSSGEEI